jgi:hypothetical protein
MVTNDHSKFEQDFSDMLDQLKANAERNSYKIKRAEKNIDRISEKEDTFG